MLAGMKATLSQAGRGRLERLCRPAARVTSARGDRIRIGTGGEGIERLEAHFMGQAFSPHRHDTYAIGVTLSGVQSFRYRGTSWHSLPGQCHVLHPDETHDGEAGSEEGFGYRIAYIDPWLVQQALGGKPLPFVHDPVVDMSLLPQGFAEEVWTIDGEIDDVGQVEIAVAVATMLVALSSGGVSRTDTIALGRLSLIRELLADNPTERHSMDELERLSGLDRWTIARQFRAAFGTSPRRFRTMRQLDHVRRLLQRGTTLAEASVEAGFADQSHMSRRFKSAYGRTPADWVRRSADAWA
jgi:AraC-like DNA-binding protein